MSKKKVEQNESIIEIDWQQFETLKEIIDGLDMEMFDETKIRIHQKGNKTWGHISGYVEPEPPDDLEEDFIL
jgi:PDZ domain-containing secreted protein